MHCACLSLPACVDGVNLQCPPVVSRWLVPWTSQLSDWAPVSTSQHVCHLRPHLPHISHMSLHSFASHFCVTCHSLTHTINITALISLGHYIRILLHHEIFLTLSHTLNTLISFASPLISCSFSLPLPSLFPTMPRHNFYAATPYIKQFCNKYGLEYNLKPVFTAFADIVW